MGGTEGIVDVDRAKLGEGLSELLDRFRIGFDAENVESVMYREYCEKGKPTLGLLALGVLAASLLFGVESQVLEQEDLAVLAVGNGLLNLGANTVRKEGDGLGEEFLELGGLLTGN